MRIARDNFVSEIRACTRSLDQQHIDPLVRDLLEEVYDKEIVQEIDWKYACSIVRRTWKWRKLPTTAFVIEKYDEAKHHSYKNRGVTTVPCDVCDAFGVVLTEEEEGYREFIGCTCENRPRWVKQNVMELAEPSAAQGVSRRGVFERHHAPTYILTDEQKHQIMQDVIRKIRPWRERGGTPVAIKEVLPSYEEECPW